MTTAKVLKVNSESVEFSNGFTLCSYHSTDCCETHFLGFGDLSIDDFKDLEFDLANDNFFRRIQGYGIELIPTKGHSVKIPGYASNNGYYSSELELVLTTENGVERRFDITECQDY